MTMPSLRTTPSTLTLRPFFRSEHLSPLNSVSLLVRTARSDSRKPRSGQLPTSSVTSPVSSIDSPPPDGGGGFGVGEGPGAGGAGSGGGGGGGGCAACVTATCPALLTSIVPPRSVVCGFASTVNGIAPSPWPFAAPRWIQPAVAWADQAQSRLV